MTGRRVAVCARTRAEVERRLRQALVERDQGMPAISTTMSVAEFAAHWLETKQPSWKQNSYRFNEQYVRVHVEVDGRRAVLRAGGPCELALAELPLECDVCPFTREQQARAHQWRACNQRGSAGGTLAGSIAATADASGSA